MSASSQTENDRCNLLRAIVTFMRRLAWIVLMALPALLIVSASATAKPRTLQGTTGPGFTITLKEKGKRVTRLPAGTYRFRISDRSSMHDFALRGPGIDRQLTGVAFTGTKTVTLRLRKGRYTFYCTPHPDSMRGAFRVR